MKEQIYQKFRNNSGESIAETLVALLISSLALMMLAGAITAATRVITQSKKKIAEYYAADTAVAQQEGASGSVHMTLSDKSGGEGSVPAAVFSVNSYQNGTFSNHVVVSYAVPGKSAGEGG